MLDIVDCHIEVAKQRGQSIDLHQLSRIPRTTDADVLDRPSDHSIAKGSIAKEVALHTPLLSLEQAAKQGRGNPSSAFEQQESYH